MYVIKLVVVVERERSAPTLALRRSASPSAVAGAASRPTEARESRVSEVLAPRASVSRSAIDS